MNNNGLANRHTGFQYRNYNKDEEGMIKKYLKKNKVTKIETTNDKLSRNKFKD